MTKGSGPFLKFSVVLAFVAASAFAQAEFRNVIVRFDIETDGNVRMSELCDIVVPEGVTSIERTYGGPLTFLRLLQPVNPKEALLQEFDSPRPDTIRWKIEPGTHRFVIESRISNAIFSTLDVPAARQYWREARPTHFVFDYVFVLPPRSTTGTTVQLQLYWPGGWSPVHEITPETVALDLGDAYRLRHLFASQTLPLAPKQLIRPASIALVPVAGLLFWFVYAARELLRRRMAGNPVVDEQFLRKKIYDEAPEVIAAQWSGTATTPTIEAFLRRLEKHRKVALKVERTEEDVKVNVRLLVPRSELSAYDRAGIDALIPTGMEVSSDQIRERYRNADFDPTRALAAALKHIADEHRGTIHDAWYSKVLSFALFWSGVALIAFHFERRLAIATAIASIGLTLLWPAALTRRLRFGLVLPLLAIVIATAAAVYINMTGPIPHPYASLGLSLLMLSAVKATMSQSSGRESRKVLERKQELAAARAWLQNARLLRDDADSWLEALQLPRRSERKPADESWGWALTSMPD